MRYDFLIMGFLVSMASVMIFVAVYIFTRKESLFGIKLLGLLSVLNALFYLGEAAYILADKPTGILSSVHISLFGFIYMTTFWYLISEQQKHRERHYSVQRLILLLIMPTLALITLCLFPWTPSAEPLAWWQSLFYSGYTDVGSTIYGDGFVGYTFTKGIFFYIFGVYSMIVTGFAAYNYYTVYREKKEIRLHWVFVATIAGVLFYGMSFTTRSTSVIDFAPLATFIAELILFITLYKYELLDLTPFAYSQVFHGAALPLFILDKSQNVTLMNSKAKELIGDRFKGRDQINLKDFNELNQEFYSALTVKGYFDYKSNSKTRSMYYHVILEPIYQNHKIIGYLLTYQDITAHKLEMKRMEYMANYDDLTKILNRRVFFQKGIEIFDEAVIHKSSVSFIMFDLDDFKEVNDIYGHQAGDFVLCELAKLCTETIDEDVIFARYGGEEFVMFAKNKTPDEGVELATRLQEKINDTPIHFMKHKIHVTASFGVSGTDKQITKSFEQYLKDADDALYESKGNGKNQVHAKI